MLHCFFLLSVVAKILCIGEQTNSTLILSQMMFLCCVCTLLAWNRILNTFVQQLTILKVTKQSYEEGFGDSTLNILKIILNLIALFLTANESMSILGVHAHSWNFSPIVEYYVIFNFAIKYLIKHKRSSQPSCRILFTSCEYRPFPLIQSRNCNGCNRWVT